MPPLPAWFDGRGDVVRFIGDRVFATPWRLLPMTANGQPAFACYQGVDGAFRLSVLNVLHVRRGRIAWIAAFLDLRVLRHVGMSDDLDQSSAHR